MWVDPPPSRTGSLPQRVNEQFEYAAINVGASPVSVGYWVPNIAVQ